MMERLAVQAQTDVTISLGVATFKETMPDKETLNRRADESLSLAKKNGQNRIERSV